MKKLFALTAFLCCLLCTAAHADIYISEAVSKNLTLHPDEGGKVHDYVILSNNGQASVPLTGMTLCDEAGKAYPLPDRSLAPGEQLLIYCTGKDGGAPFKLSDEGETLFIKNADGSAHGSLNIPALNANERYVDGKIVFDRKAGAAVSSVRLSEVCASNSMVAVNGETPDWVEIENTGSQAADLSGWYLSDNASKPLRWRLPEGFTLAAGERKVIYLHESTVNFKLSSEGEAVVLTDKSGRVMDYVVFGPQKNDTSLVLKNGTWQTTYFVTPGKANQIVSKATYEKKVFSDNKTGVYISEVLTASANYTNKGNRYDYIELYNSTSKRVSLSGWYLSDSASNPKKWAFPKNAFIPAKGYAIIYADGRELTTQLNSVYYATFKLSQDNDVVLLSKGDKIVDHISLGDQYGGISCGRMEGGAGEIVFFEKTTPQKKNPQTGYRVQTAAPVLSHKGGILTKSVSVKITAPAGATIYYTLNGETPTTKSKVYSGPISVGKTTLLRAAAYKKGELISPVVSASYLFGVSSAVPIVSLITDDKYLNDYDMGLFKRGDDKEPNYMNDWEYPVHVQYFENGELKIDQLSSFRITGGTSRMRAQKGMAVYARGALSEDRFPYSPFEHRDYTDIKAFTLRAAGTESSGTRFKDAFLTSLAAGTHVMYQDARTVNVYINGKFWGHYNLREKINKYSIAQWEGITDEDVIDNIIILKNKGYILQGSRDDITELIKFCRTKDLNKKANLQYVLDRIDVMSWFDHTIFEIISGNKDLENVRYYKVPGGKWKVCLFDLDNGMKDTKAYPIGRVLADPNDQEVTHLFHEPMSALLKVPSMRDLFLKRFGEILYEKFQPKALDAQIDEWVKVISPLIPAQHERWGTGDIKAWNKSVSTLRTYCRERPAAVVEHLRTRFSLSDAEVKKYFGAFLGTVK
ncbi:MAG: lamin tail domain-containing protein [Clostridia bacterium]|nr:lamin tail domain-containing protein [Clostridia bacterium]